MTPEQQAAADRWQAFLDKIEERLEAIVAEADAGIKGIAAAHPHEILPILNALSGLDHRVRQLLKRIEEVWDGKAGRAFGGSNRGIEMKEESTLRFNHRWQKARTTWLADIARAAHQDGLKELEEPVDCSGCGAPIPRQVTGSTISITCEYCNAVNQVAPPAALRNFFHYGVDHLAEEAALEMRHETERLRLRIETWQRANSWAPVPSDHRQKWEAMQRAHLQRQANEKARLLGRPVNQDWVESRMKLSVAHEF